MKKQDAAKKTFHVPGGLLFPFIGIEAIIWLPISLSKWKFYLPEFLYRRYL